jgi:hypothetical protein
MVAIVFHSRKWRTESLLLLLLSQIPKWRLRLCTWFAGRCAVPALSAIGVTANSIQIEMETALVRLQRQERLNNADRTAVARFRLADNTAAVETTATAQDTFVTSAFRRR